MDTMTIMGSNMLTARFGIPSLAQAIATAAEISGSAPSRSSLPSSLTRRSASRIGPMSHPVKITAKTSTSALRA